LKPTHEQRWNPLIGLVVSGAIASLLIATLGPNPLLVAYLLFAGMVWLLLATGVLDQ
jgi:membrane protease YdiL (CAAX protease family)|tara:strand:- start:763 stop:933 length:171 start_codon:yes stop_codon:yes gene_type:complete